MNQNAKTYSGGCLCGAVRFKAEGQYSDATHCHCSLCRRASGAPFVTWVTFAHRAVRFSGELAIFKSSPTAVRGFCANCGTSLSFANDAYPHELDLTLASFDEPEAIQPQDHIWTSSKLSWIVAGDDLPCFEERRLGHASDS